MLILTEKPSVAKAFAYALNVQKNKEGYWENSEYLIVNAVGHLLESYEPEDYDPRYGKWRIEDLPIMPDKFLYKPVKDLYKQLCLIRRCFIKRGTDTLLVATDAEREGEIIAAEILEFAGVKSFKSIKRFWVSEALIPSVVLNGIREAKDISHYDGYRIKGFARQKADWLTGMNLSRVVSIGADSNFSVGRVQTAIVNAVYERDNEISNFKKEKFYELLASLRSGDTIFSLKLVNPDSKEFPTRFNESSSLLKKAEGDLTLPRAGKITSASTEKITTPPPPLYNLTALQKDAFQAFSFTPEKTLQAAQKLYETHKCLSYPRTPSKIMGDNNVELVLGVFDKLKKAYEYTSDIESYIKNSDRAAVAAGNKRVFNSAKLKDHHALIPLNVIPADASDEERSVFFLVVKRFFLVFKKDYVFEKITLNASIKGYGFAGGGIKVLRFGWRENIKEDESEENENDLTNVIEGNSYPFVSVERFEKHTRAKKHFNYASLLALMENPRDKEDGCLVGLGTPATRAAILKKIVDTGYISCTKNIINILDKGKFLIDTIRQNDKLKEFISLSQTTLWEEKLEENTPAFLNDIKNLVIEIISDMKLNPPAQKKLTSFGKCPLCASDVFEGKKSYYCSSYKEGCEFKIWKESFGTAINAADVSRLIGGKETAVKNCLSKAGKKYKAYFSLDETGKMTPRFESK
jgi:DNA topoisomerase-3